EARLLVGAATTGACMRSFNETIARLNERRAFGRPVGNFPSVQDRVAGMLADVLALESLVHAVAGSDGPPRIDPLEPAVVRLAASRAAGRVLDASRDLFGAAAFGGAAGPARRWTDTRALTLLDGSDSALESYVFLEGSRELRRRAEGAADTLEPWARLDALSGHALARVRARLRRVRSGEAQGVPGQELLALVHRLGERVHEEIRQHGRDIVEKQHVHRRLARIVADLATWEALSTRLATELRRHGPVGARRMVEVAEIWIGAATERLEGQFNLLARNDDALRDGIATRAYQDGSYPFDIM
ncbi:MAG TPA: acyl-CoA dehydrogenase family protein, partial [Polyangiaceae bacterium]|nr:acyl-CoA dehydrogenase family protein [Polyangiaceae bacterium]